MDTLKALSCTGDTLPEGAAAAELTMQKNLLRRALSRLDAIKTNCHGCKLFQMDVCEKHGAVPVEFQRAVDQCDDWRFDGVPF